WLFIDQRQQFIAGTSPAEVKDRRRAGDVLYLARELCQELLGALARLFFHPLLDRGELLDTGRLGHGEEGDLAAGVESAQCRVAQGNAHLLGLVDDDEEDAFV